MAAKRKKGKKKKIKKQINKTQVEKEDFDIKGNKCCERRREVSDGSDLIGGWPPPRLDSLVCVLGKTEGDILSDFCQVKDASYGNQPLLRRRTTLVEV